MDQVFLVVRVGERLQKGFAVPAFEDFPGNLPELRRPYADDAFRRDVRDQFYLEIPVRAVFFFHKPFRQCHRTPHLCPRTLTGGTVFNYSASDLPPGPVPGTVFIILRHICPRSARGGTAFRNLLYICPAARRKGTFPELPDNGKAPETMCSRDFRMDPRIPEDAGGFFIFWQPSFSAARR